MVGTKPVLHIEILGAKGLFKAGDKLRYKAAVDEVDGDYGDYNFEWTITFGHDNHFHPVKSSVFGEEVEFEVPYNGHPFSGNTYYRFECKFTDRVGLYTQV